MDQVKQYDAVVIGAGLSGLTANPLVGRMADAVSAAGGKVVLTEIPEIFGAEQTLMDRATSRAIWTSRTVLRTRA